MQRCAPNVSRDCRQTASGMLRFVVETQRRRKAGDPQRMARGVSSTRPLSPKKSEKRVRIDPVSDADTRFSDIQHVEPMSVSSTSPPSRTAIESAGFQLLKGCKTRSISIIRAARASCPLASSRFAGNLIGHTLIVPDETNF